MGLDFEVVQDGQKEVGDGQRNAAYQLGLEVHLFSGWGRRCPLAGRRRPPGKPLRRGEVALGDHLLDVATVMSEPRQSPLCESVSLSRGSNTASFWSPPVVSITADAGMTSPSGGTMAELVGFAAAS